MEEEDGAHSMKAIDFRNATFEELRAQLCAKREHVWMDWQHYEMAKEMSGQSVVSGATTREVCEHRKRDILQFRPRCTELYQMGALMLCEVRSEKGEGRSSEGRYRLRTTDEWQAWLNEQREAAVSGQLQLV